jgi:hypothetical protein
MSFVESIAAERSFVQKGESPLKVIRRWPLGEKLGNERLLLNVERALAAYHAR